VTSTHLHRVRSFESVGRISGALNESDDVLAKDKSPAGWRANFYPTGLNDSVVASAYGPSVPL
jgi:hypothetical protein